MSLVGLNRNPFSWLKSSLAIDGYGKKVYKNLEIFVGVFEVVSWHSKNSYKL